MEYTRELLKKTYNLCRLQIKVSLRRQSTLLMRIGFLVLIIICPLSWGILFTNFYLNNLKLGVNPQIAYRDLMTFGFLTFFITCLCYLIAIGATGLRNPYIKSRQDAQFFQRVPVESSVIYFSARLAGFLMTAIFIVPFVVFLFEPLMLVLNLPWWRIGGVVVVFLLTFNLCGNIADLAFFALRRFRRKGNWSSIWFDSSSPIIGIIILGVPVIAFLMLQQNAIPTFETLTVFSLFPFINTAVIATSFFFRSGVPWESWMALIFLSLESGIFALIMGIIAANHRPMEDITEIMPVLSFQAAQLEDLVGGKTIEPPELINEDIKGNSVFSGKSPWRAYLLKDWLAIKRIRALRNQIYRAPIVVIGVTIAILFIPQEYSFALLWIVIYSMADFSMLIARLEIKDPMQRFPADSWTMTKSKFLIMLFVTGFYGISLFVAKGLVSLVIIVLVTILSTIIGKTKWGVLKARFLTFGIMFLTTPLLFLG